MNDSSDDYSEAELDEETIDAQRTECYQLALATVTEFCADIISAAGSLGGSPLERESVVRIQAILGQMHTLRPAPTIQAALPSTREDCLISYFFAILNQKLGKINSAHYYKQEALTLIESSQIDPKLKGHGCQVDAMDILQRWLKEAGL